MAIYVTDQSVLNISSPVRKEDKRMAVMAKKYRVLNGSLYI